MRVTFEIADDVWWKLGTLADGHHTTVPRLVGEAVADLLRPGTSARIAAEIRRQRIISLAHEKYPDRLIAERTGELIGFVADVRRSAGIPPARSGRSAPPKRGRPKGRRTLSGSPSGGPSS